MARSYQKRERAKSQEETRRRIVEAAVALHEAKGVAATSMRDIAERANVGTVTVYRHFPDIETLVGACSAHYFGLHPLPDPESWSGVTDPDARFRAAIAESYAFFSETAAMLRSVLPEIRGKPLGAHFEAHWRRAAEVLMQGRTGDDRALRQTRAAISLALRFDTWDALTSLGLSDSEAASLVSRLFCRC